MGMPHNDFRPEKYGMVFCSKCHGSGKDEGGKAACLKCGGFGLLIRNDSPCPPVLCGEPAGLRKKEGLPGMRKGS